MITNSANITHDVKDSTSQTTIKSKRYDNRKYKSQFPCNIKTYKNYKIHFNFRKIVDVLKVFRLNIVVKYNDKKNFRIRCIRYVVKY